MLDEFNGIRTETTQFKAFSISIDTLRDMEANPCIASVIFEKRIVLANGYKSFQDPKKIAEGLSYIWDEKHKWTKIASELGMSSEECTKKLNNIVLRRNQIAHEGDYVDIYTERQSIGKTDVEEVKAFILKLGEAIFNQVV